MCSGGRESSGFSHGLSRKEFAPKPGFHEFIVLPHIQLVAKGMKKDIPETTVDGSNTYHPHQGGINSWRELTMEVLPC